MLVFHKEKVQKEPPSHLFISSHISNYIIHEFRMIFVEKSFRYIIHHTVEKKQKETYFTIFNHTSQII